MILTNSTGAAISILDNNQNLIFDLLPNAIEDINPNQFFYISLTNVFNQHVIYSRYGNLPVNGTLLNIGGDYVIQNNQGNITTRFALLH